MEKSCCDTKQPKSTFSASVKPYMPLISLTLITAAAGAAVNYSSGDNIMTWMHYFMGFFLCSFAMLKIFNLQGFANGFQMYDLLAIRYRGYALSYPFIELALGLGYLAFVAPYLVYGTTIVVMVFGARGVLKALKNGLDIDCPCMGSILKVPLSTVTLTENLLMAVMAAYMLITL